LPAGKSCFLESVGFGLGASAAELRVNNLSELCGKNSTGQRTRVVLKFIKGSVSMTIGSTIIDGTRLYLINSNKVTKIKFCQSLTDTLGFSKDSISWNISQRAVQEIVSKFMNTQYAILLYIFVYVYRSFSPKRV
jgi:chromosome segregation ATPase